MKLHIPLPNQSGFYSQSEFSQVHVCGLNDSDQLGPTNQSKFDTFVKMEIGKSTIKQVQMSSKGTLFLTDTGDLLLAGDMSQKSDENFEKVKGLCLEKISAHSTGRHWLGIDKFGQIWAAGDNSEGQCGQPVAQNRIHEPVRIQNLPAIIEISAGFDYSLAVSQTGKVFGWGNASGARLTAKIASPRTIEPVLIEIDDFISHVSAGSQGGFE